MSAAILNQGKTSLRDAWKSLVTHVCISDDNTAFSGAHTGINPAAGATSTHVEATTDTDVDGNTFDSTITIDGNSEFTGKNIYAIGLAKGFGVRSATGAGGTHTGGGTVGTDTLTRAVRTLAIGVQAGDLFNLGVRSQAQDNS